MNFLPRITRIEFLKFPRGEFVIRRFSIGFKANFNLPSVRFSTFKSRISDVSASRVPVVQLRNDAKVIVNWQDGKTSKFQPFWLRDHCHCSECYHEVTKQRIVNTFKIPRTIRTSSVDAKLDGMNISWSNDGHVSFYKWSWLRRHSYDPPLAEKSLNKKVLWNAEEIKSSLPVVQYVDVMNTPAGLVKWIKNIDQYGIAFVDGVPANPEKTEELVKKICFIRETHYGGFYDFTADLSHGDMAYTTLALGVHTDNTYFTEPSGLQIFHVIEFNGQGGQSVFVDGFNVAKQFKAQHPDAYKTLSTIRVPSHSAGDKSTCIEPTPHAFPILNHDPLNGELYQVRYNNDDRSTLDHLTAVEVDAFYDSLRKWNDLLQDRSNEFWIQLTPGRMVVFDNWRVLHGRAAFTGHRRLTGAYLNWDYYRSKVKVSQLSEEEIIEGL